MTTIPASCISKKKKKSALVDKSLVFWNTKNNVLFCNKNNSEPQNFIQFRVWTHLVIKMFLNLYVLRMCVCVCAYGCVCAHVKLLKCFWICTYRGAYLSFVFFFYCHLYHLYSFISAWQKREGMGSGGCWTYLCSKWRGIFGWCHVDI